MTRAASASARHGETRATRPLPASYLKRSQLPLASLVLLLPFIALYELGTRLFAFDAVHQTEQRIIAFTLMQDFFNLFGATGRFMPPLAVVGILLAVHIAHNDPWKVKPATLAGMAVESAAWGLPLLALGTLTARYLPHVLPLAGGGEGSSWPTLFVLSVGAGIYEELVFRLAALTILHLLLRDVLKLPRRSGYLLMVLISSLAFAFYHYLGSEAFAWRSIVFRTVAGAYFAGLLLWRGFGITALSHSCYDLYVVSLRWLCAA
jgi:membrane protease YdiL (CAAX protease family)